MKKRIVALLAGVLLAVTGTFAFGVSPASAHNFDSASYFTCQAERVEWTSSSYTTHSHPDTMTTEYVDYHCCLDLYGISHRWNYSTRWWNGSTTSHGWGPVYAGWCP